MGVKNLRGFGSDLLQLLLQVDSQPGPAAVLGILIQQGKGSIHWSKGAPTAAVSGGLTQVLSVCHIPSLRALLDAQILISEHQITRSSSHLPPSLLLCARDRLWDAPGAPVALTALKNDLGTLSPLIKQETSNIPGL